jgi:PilZ domain-containing protein
VSGVVTNADPLTIGVPPGSVEDGAALRLTLWGAGDRWEVEGTAAVRGSRLTVASIASCRRRDRRRWPRRAARLGVTVHVWDRAVAELHPHPARSVDVSCGGLCIVTGAPMATGSEPTVIVPLPGGTQVMAKAEVLEGSEERGGWRYRLAFLDLRPVDVDRLAAFVASTDRTPDPP